MKCNKYPIRMLGCAGLILSFQTTALLADICSKDEALKERFLSRNDNFEELTALRSDYDTLMKTKAESPSDKEDCMHFIGRLDILRGGLLPELNGENPSAAKYQTALDECLATNEHIRFTNSTTYHYFNSSCLALRGKAEESSIRRMSYAQQAGAARGPALESAEKGADIEGGGIYRVQAALAGNRKTQALGLYNSEQALSYAEKALEAPEKAIPPFSGTFTGEDFYENHFYKAQALIASAVDHGNKDQAEKAIRLLEDKISEMEFDEAGQRAIENKAYQKIMEKFLEKMKPCMGNEETWQSCLQQRSME